MLLLYSRLILKLSPEDGKQVIDGVLLEVGTVDEFFTRRAQHRLGSGETHILECLDYPLVNLVLELVEIDILLALGLDIAVTSML